MSRNFGDIVKRRRSALGMTQARLAELVGRSISTIRAWERNRTHPSDTETLAAVVAVLGITEPELVDADLELPGGVPVRPAAFPSSSKVATPPDQAPRVVGRGSTAERHPEQRGSDSPTARSNGGVDDGPADEPYSSIEDGDRQQRRLPVADEEDGESAAEDDGALLSESAGEEDRQSAKESAAEDDGGIADGSTHQDPGALGGELTGEDGSSASTDAVEADSANPTDHLSELDMPADAVDLGERTQVLEQRVLGVGTSADALRPEPSEPAPSSDDAMEPTQVVAPPSADDPFAATAAAQPPVVTRQRAPDPATAVGGMSGSTMALERRPTAVPDTAYENYLDDPDEERRYRIRAVLTVVIMIALFLFLRWSLSGMTEAIGQLWSNFRGHLKL